MPVLTRGNRFPVRPDCGQLLDQLIAFLNERDVGFALAEIFQAP
jgi:hypothetical protein